MAFLLRDPKTGKIDEFHKGDVIIRVGSMDKYRVMGTWDLGIWVHKMTSKDPASKMINADRVDREKWIILEKRRKR